MQVRDAKNSSMIVSATSDPTRRPSIAIWERNRQKKVAKAPRQDVPLWKCAIIAIVLAFMLRQVSLISDRPFASLSILVDLAHVEPAPDARLPLGVYYATGPTVV